MSPLDLPLELGMSLDVIPLSLRGMSGATGRRTSLCIADALEL
jgi:hypothetical protein